MSALPVPAPAETSTPFGAGQSTTSTVRPLAFVIEPVVAGVTLLSANEPAGVPEGCRLSAIPSPFASRQLWFGSDHGASTPSAGSFVPLPQLASSVPYSSQAH